MVDLDDTPDPSAAKNDPAGFLSDSFMFMVFAGIALGLVKLGNMVIAERMVGLWDSLSNAVSNTADNADTSDPIEVF